MLGRVLSGTAIVIILAGAARATAAVPVDVLASPTEFLLAERSMRACAGYCVSCAATGHAADAAPSECTPSTCTPDAKVGGGWHTACEGANTCGDHSCSGGDAEENAEALALGMNELHEAVGSALVAGDYDALSKLLQANPNRLHLAAARQALQITACDGAVIAHYPVTEAALSSLQLN